MKLLSQQPIQHMNLQHDTLLLKKKKRQHHFPLCHKGYDIFIINRVLTSLIVLISVLPSFTIPFDASFFTVMVAIELSSRLGL